MPITRVSPHHGPDVTAQGCGESLQTLDICSLRLPVPTTEYTIKCLDVQIPNLFVT
jgi:hypothetical protein